MATRRRTSALNSLIRAIVGSAGRRPKKLAVSRIETQFHSSSRQDYAGQLGALFDRRQMRELIADFRNALPTLNAEVFRIREPRRLARVAAQLGARFQGERFEGEAGTSLRGFYIHDRGTSSGPLICVNTAKHPVAVASAFWHELGHHLTTQIYDVSRPIQFSFSSSYGDHLSNPLEIAADVVSALAAYPKPAAQRLFGGFIKTGRAPDIDDLVSRAQTHLRSVAGFDIPLRVPATENLHYLAGVIHFIRLRWVLFAEYEI
jgi:hypothetical protein